MHAQEVYDRFDTDMAKVTIMDKQENLPQGWNMKYNMHDKFTKSKEIPEGPKIKTNETKRYSTGMESNSSRLETSGEPSRGLEMDEKIISKWWKGGVYEIVLEKLELIKGWKDDAEYIKAAWLEFMVENKETTMMEEGEDILDGLESMLTEDGSGVTEDVLIDAT